jgi:hypothetical protein
MLNFYSEIKHSIHQQEITKYDTSFFLCEYSPLITYSTERSISSFICHAAGLEISQNNDRS